MKRATLIIAAFAVLAFAGSAGSASAYTRGCYYPLAGGYGPINDRSINIGDVSVRNMRCRDALHAINVSRLLRNGNIRTPHFGCHKLRTYSSGATILVRTSGVCTVRPIEPSASRGRPERDR